MIAFGSEGGLDAAKLLGPDGLVAQAWSDFESRPQQYEMAQRVIEALRGDQHLIAEAGTGIGKSFAYLAGAIDQIYRKERPVVISTYTIHLQHQLVVKDIPFLAGLLEQGFTCRLAMGRGNYVCLRRLDYAKKRAWTLFDDSGQEVAAIAEWAGQAQEGCLAEMDIHPSSSVWQAVQSEHGNCRGRRCSFFGSCFYQQARRQLESADIIVVNHALLLSDLILKAAGAGLLPDFKKVIIDEAHTLEHVAEDHAGLRVSQGMLKYLLDDLYNLRKNRGLLSHLAGADEARSLVRSCRQAVGVFFTQVHGWLANAKDKSAVACTPGFVEDTLSHPFRLLRTEIGKLAKTVKDEDEKYELLRAKDRCQELEKGILDFLGQTEKGFVYWVEMEQNNPAKITLRSAPLDVSPFVKSVLFEPCESVILTSATLSCARGDDAFSFFASRIGLQDYHSLKVGSPFDYASQVKVYIQADMPDPNQPQFVQKAVAAIQTYLLKSDGRAFVLFTSFEMLKRVAEQMQDWMRLHDMEMLVQGQGLNRMRLLERFKEDVRSVLFGTDSFWQGVDVPGESLSNVIIVRLPFASPGHPLIEGRIESLRAKGHNPFYEYQLPMAILKFKQGFGRLIRNKTDTGMVVILDSRIVSKSYGKMFLDALPECDVEMVKTDHEME